MESKVRFRAVIVVIVSVLAASGLYVAATMTTAPDTAWTLVTAVILAVMALVALAVAWGERQEVKRGFPKEDERSRAIRMRAGYWAFFISLYFLFFVSMVQALLEDHQIASFPTAEWGMINVAIMGAIFLVVHGYFNRKGVAT